MTSTSGSTRSELSEDMWPTEPLLDAKIRPVVLKSKEPSFRRRAARALIIFCTGVAATVAWQSYSGEIREMIAISCPQLGWLAPQSAFAETAPVPNAPPVNASDALELKSILINVAALRQSVDQLAVQFLASQQQMASDIAKMKAAEQDIFDKISSAPPPRPAAARARKPVPVSSPPQPSQTSPVR